MEYDYVELKTVLIITQPSLLPIAKSILEDAKIRYYAKGERIQNLFAVGQIGAGYNTLTGPIKLQVAESDYEEAHELLADLINEEK